MLTDDKLKQALHSYVQQIAQALMGEKAADVGVILILARSDGAGGFKAHDAAAINGRNMDGPTKRRILMGVHDNSGVL